MCLPYMGIPRGMREQENTNNFMNKKDVHFHRVRKTPCTQIKQLPAKVSDCLIIRFHYARAIKGRPSVWETNIIIMPHKAKANLSVFGTRFCGKIETLVILHIQNLKTLWCVLSVHIFIPVYNSNVLPPFILLVTKLYSFIVIYKVYSHVVKIVFFTPEWALSIVCVRCDLFV